MGIVIPDVLQMQEGSCVSEAEKWNARREEILELFTREVYGRIPFQNQGVKVERAPEDDYIYNGMVKRRKQILTATTDRGTFSFPVWTFLPAKGHNFPVFVYCMLRGQAEQYDLDGEAHMSVVPVEEITARGYAVVIYRVTDIAPDSYDGFHSGVFAQLDGARRADSWGTIAAWAWAGSRVMDYICSDTACFDSARACIVGHSRGGKTALWCGACDTRFQLVISNNSGCTGAAISRGKQGEDIAAINRQFPHWFCENYKKYNGHEELLPVDQHMLLALIAPRLLYVTSASEDLWADPEKELESCRLASAVYRLFGETGLKAPEQIVLDRQYGEGKIAYHRRTGEHKLTEFDWKLFMDYADRKLK